MSAVPGVESEGGRFLMSAPLSLATILYTRALSLALVKSVDDVYTGLFFVRSPRAAGGGCFARQRLRPRRRAVCAFSPRSYKTIKLIEVFVAMNPITTVAQTLTLPSRENLSAWMIQRELGVLSTVNLFVLAGPSRIYTTAVPGKT